MTMASETWRTLHTVIDGALIDRDEGYPDLELDMEPVGTSLPKDQQTVQLVLRIGKSRTVIDNRGVEQLRRFLAERP